MRELLETWPGEFVVIRRDHPTGTWMFIAIHDLTLGPAMGGCRMRTYATPDDGLRDAMRLAEGMTHKWATIGFDLGGGKSVLAVPGPLSPAEREGLFERFGALVESLGGVYACGPDLGTTPYDMTVIGRRTTHVHGAARRDQGEIDPGPFTALGVYSGMRAALHQVFGSPDVTGRTVHIQGVGDVGAPLGRLLAEAGATLLVSDVNPTRAKAFSKKVNARILDPDAAIDVECDVYAPCAVGATLNAESIPRLKCRIVAGSANNQLAEPADADRLHARGILYAPDYVINAGGATALPLLGRGGKVDEIEDRLRGFEGILTEIFEEAKARNTSPEEGARARVERVLASRRASTG